MAAIAPVRSDFGTSDGSIASQAGVFTDHAALSRNVVRSRVRGVARSNETSAANATTTATTPQDVARISRRGSTMSASAPAGRVNRNIGRVVAAWTSEIVAGSRSRVVISHPDAVSYIEVPTSARAIAAQTTAKGVWENAPSHAQRASAGVSRNRRLHGALSAPPLAARPVVES